VGVEGEMVAVNTLAYHMWPQLTRATSTCEGRGECQCEALTNSMLTDHLLLVGEGFQAV